MKPPSTGLFGSPTALDSDRRLTFSRRREGAALLEAICKFVRRFVLLSDAQLTVIAAWVVHTHALVAAETTPYLAITSAEKQCGKTRLLETLEVLVHKPWHTGRVTSAVLVRKIDAHKPTLLLDESDAAFSGDPEYAETLRGVLNTGHRRGGCASLCVGQGTNISFKDFETFCPKAIAGIGRLPDTLADRSIPVHLKRKAPSELVERFRRRDISGEANAIRKRIPVWVSGLRKAVVEIFGGESSEDQSLGVRLLADIWAIFDSSGADKMTSMELVSKLAESETSPWGEYKHGKPLNPVGMARLLKRYGIFPRTIRLDAATPKGYLRESFLDAWERYLPPRVTSVATDSGTDPQHPPQPTVHADKADGLEPQPTIAVAWSEIGKTSTDRPRVAGVAAQKPEQKGPIFANASGNALSLGSVVNRVILPTLNRCETCHNPEGECDQKILHEYKRDASLPEWHGWHAARRGLGSNLYRVGVPDMVIQRILRHANVSTTATYYIKTAADDVRNAMAKLESNIPSANLTPEIVRDTYRTPNLDSTAVPATVN